MISEELYKKFKTLNLIIMNEWMKNLIMNLFSFSSFIALANSLCLFGYLKQSTLCLCIVYTAVALAFNT